ncbi:spatzle 5 Toll-1 receptor isoform X2 [Nomia melanderi]|uniref:spatzle 5 Toll-1 receptor isoform X2 n=1 Tax=Nomia melanderi TaxID=2448451 RepID=UPI0013047463|nr:protein spaetzle 5 isoform X2 [Nomia melanderi]
MRRLLSLLAVISLGNTHSQPCIEYGCPGRPQFETFVPAPPGHTPNCAKPGQTFCENVDHYPRQLIKFLVDKCSFDFISALRDESKDEFNVHWPIPDYTEGYNYAQRGQPQLHSHPLPFLPSQYPLRGQPSLIYGAPSNDTQQNGYRYNTPNRAHGNPFLNDGTNIKYHPDNSHTTDRPFYPQTHSLNSFGQGRPWWTARYTRDSKTAPRTAYENPLLRYSKLSKERQKRQSNNPETIHLCPTVAKYISPRAALNNQGNWMYVVNLPDDKYSQVVRSETCMETVCNGICSLPTGYTSKCEQLYVQKRLVALKGNGNELYNDLFWFPHGCSCQIMLNY